MKEKEAREEVARSFMSEILSLFDRLFPDGLSGPLALRDVLSVDLAPLLSAEGCLDSLGMDALSCLSLEELLLLAHRMEAIDRALAPFAREDGPLSLRIRSLSEAGPLSAYRKASRDSGARMVANMIGRI